MPSVSKVFKSYRLLILVSDSRSAELGGPGSSKANFLGEDAAIIVAHRSSSKWIMILELSAC
jgi:hypothetical protein